jgi:hypothetical protein
MITLMKLSGYWLSFAVITVGVISYFVSLTIDGVFGKDGFGTIGNMVVLTVGFFGGLIAYERAGYYLSSFQVSTYVGVGGALLTFMTLAFLKLILDKIMH